MQVAVAVKSVLSFEAVSQKKLSRGMYIYLYFSTWLMNPPIQKINYRLSVLAIFGSPITPIISHLW